MRIRRYTMVWILAAVLFTGNVFAGGELDLSFGSGGKVLVGTAQSYEEARDAAIQSDGKIVVAGITHRFNGGTLLSSVMVARLLPNGQPDQTFGIFGTTVNDLSQTDTENVSAVKVQRDGKIVVVGTRLIGGGTANTDIFVVRYNPNGTLDATFGNNGSLIIAAGNQAIGADCLILDRQILVIGRGKDVSGFSDFMLVKLNANGSMDASFGNNGIAIGPATYDSAALQGVALPNGKLLISGTTNLGGTVPRVAVARYHPNGTPDTTFGQNGRAVAWVNSAVPTNNYAHDIAVDSTGRFVVSAYDADQDFPVMRFIPQGFIDTTFGIPAGQIQWGVATLPVNTAGTYNYAVAVQADGKVITGGVHQNKFGLARYKSSGSPDATFGVGGLVTTAFNSSASSNSRINKLAIQQDGKIIAVGGNLDSAPTADAFAIARYLP